MEAYNYYSIWDEDGYESRTLRKIAYARELYDAQVKKAEKEEYVKDLLLQDYVNQIKEHVSRYDLLSIIGKAQEEIGKRLKKERPHLETVKMFLMEDFLNDDKNFKLTKIIQGGYEGYYWRFEFDAYGKTVYIEIPMMSRLTKDNIEYAHYGMFTFGVYESDHCSRMLKGTYRIKELAATIKEWAEKEKEKESN